MFGSFEIENFSAEIEDYKVRVEKTDGYKYVRERLGKVEKEKEIFTASGKVIVNPVEPVNLPKEITNFLLVKFKKPLIIEPKSFTVVYLTFPVEIGVFLAAKRSIGLIDLFSLIKPKYTLYGNPRSGVICRYWESDVYRSIPKTNYFREGVMELKVGNSDSDWAEITQAVFDVYGMKIYYDGELVYSNASINVVSQKVAETRFVEQPLREKMKKALELYTARKIAVTAGKFVMEWGL